LNNSYQHDRNAEIDYLTELINNFGNQSNLQADEAIKILYSRYDELEKKRLFFLRKTQRNANEYYQLFLNIHGFLYKNILNNSGKVRNVSEPNNGNVYFGGINYKTMKDKFMGTEPKLIKSELDEAFSILFEKQYEPIENSIRFYAEFVAIHPFYDANGRIGRYIVDIFLQSNNYYVDWQSLNQRHGKFLRKLNYCHSVRGRYKQFLYSNSSNSRYYLGQNNYWKSVREKYIGYLLNFWNQFVKSLDKLEADRDLFL
jgi:fido (protein-threonine AMPylation protein)